ncbi:hypothetical protein [Siphonobacter sp.]|uniref:hypothetical protein n=1 Tax=Siphonobacter sp. TaxID=1869184 RepID=UPI003B3A76A5
MRLTKIGKVTLIVLILGLLALVGWTLSTLTTTPTPGLTVRIAKKESARLTLSTRGGDGTPIVFINGRSGRSQLDSVFQIPVAQRNGQPITFYAVQGKDTVEVQAAFKALRSGEKTAERTSLPAGTKVKGSEYCLDCESFFLVSDGHGGTQIQTDGYNTRCCKCGSKVAFSDGYYYEILCEGDRITAKMGDKVEK